MKLPVYESQVSPVVSPGAARECLDGSEPPRLYGLVSGSYCPARPRAATKSMIGGGRDFNGLAGGPPWSLPKGGGIRVPPEGALTD